MTIPLKGYQIDRNVFCVEYRLAMEVRTNPKLGQD